MIDLKDRKIMNVVLGLIICCGIVLCFASCSDSRESISDSTAKKLFKKEMKRLNKMEQTFSIQTGYYECNDNDTRYKLRQLAANDIITYKCDIVKKQERVQKTRRVQAGYFYRYWTTESYYVNEEIDTYFVTVALTEKGQKLVSEEKEIEPSDDEKDMKNDMEIDYSKFPETNVDIVEFPSAAAGEPVAAEEEDPGCDPEIDTPEAAAGNGGTSDYDKAKAKESIDFVTLVAYEISIVKARNVEKTGDNTARAEIVVEYADVTPVGRIFMGVYEGQRFLAPGISYKFYEDKGWQLVASE